jgi:large subunit ribosomal protein L9
VEVDRRQMDSQPIRNLGEHKLHIRLTMDLVPEVIVIVHREGEAPELVTSQASTAEEVAEPEAEAEPVAVAEE